MEFEELVHVDKERMEHYIAIVEQAIAREDAIKAPNNVDHFDLNK